jgi:aspartyl-tRNA(Asn)/glutamyl-tRNA(Gln) amidotransferase subunit A
MTNAKLVPGGSSGGSASAVAPICAGRHRDRHRRLDPPAGRVHRHRRHQADLWPLLALGHRRVCLVAGSGRPDRPTVATRHPAAIDGRSRPEGFDLARPACAGLRAPRSVSVDQRACGRRAEEYRVDGMPAEIEALWQQGIEWLKDAGAEIVDDLAAAHQIRAAGLLHRRAGRSLVQPRAL